MPSADDFNVSDVALFVVAQGFEFADHIEGVVYGVNNAVVVTVGSFVFGAGLEPKSEAFSFFALAQYLVQDAMAVGVVLLKNL